MLKRWIRILHTDAAGWMLKIFAAGFVGITAVYFIGASLLFGLEEGAFGLFGSGLGVSLDQAPWENIDTVSAWEIYDLENYAMLILYIGANLLFRFGFFFALGGAVLWLAIRLLTRQSGAPEKTLRVLKIAGLIQMALPLLYGLMILLSSDRFAVETWVHIPFLEVEPGNVIFCVLIPIVYMLICTALQYLIMAAPPLLYDWLEKRTK